MSRYHRNRRFFRTGKGVNHEIHDFPSAEMGVKLGGFMVLDSVTGMQSLQRRASVPGGMRLQESPWYQSNEAKELLVEWLRTVAERKARD